MIGFLYMCSRISFASLLENFSSLYVILFELMIIEKEV